jgi:predicted RNA-binding Zn ribbon-like protein
VEAMCLDLINSEERDWRADGSVRDRLDDPAWQARFLARWAPAEVGAVVVGQADRQALRAARTILRAVVERVAAGARPDRAALAGLNGLIGATPFRYRLAPTGERGYALQQVGPDRPALAAAAALSLARLLAEGEPERLKLCANPACRWAYYDDSRNRRRRWCDATTCGNLMKVRRYRERHRAAGHAPHGYGA